LSYGRVLSSKSRIISINRSRQQATKNERLFWSADVVIEADIASTLTQIAAVLRSDPDYKGYASSEWLSSLSERDTQQELSIQTKSLQNTTDSKLNPLRVLYALDKVLKEDSIIVVDGGDFVGSAAYIVRTRGALQWLDPGAFGTLGVGAGFALGAKLVYPNRDVFIIYGDGSCGFSLMEFDTFERHALNIIAIIGNDACWSQIAREQIKIFDDDTGVNLKHVHYEEVNRAFGGLGMLLSSDTDTDKLDKFFENVIEQSNSKRKSAIVNVIIGKTDFRDGSISV
uniref:2-hydroxyacyl-CoA lyase 2 n=1 Tax=Anisakis simplex TaxID=6269 RepID=A0A0M3J365_ANISI